MYACTQHPRCIHRFNSLLQAWLHELGHALHYIASAPAGAPSDGSQQAGQPPTAAAPTAAPGTFPAAGPLPLLSGMSCPHDLKEVPSHLMEQLLRHPRALQALSCHARLGSSLPIRDASR